MAHKRFKLSRAEVHKLYVTQELTMSHIAEKYGCSVETVRKFMVDTGISARSHVAAALLCGAVNLPQAELRSLYVDKQLSTYQIAKLYKCSDSTVRHRLRLHGIPLRTRFEGSLASIGALDKIRDFSGNLEEKSYLLAFTMGDLTAVKRHPTGESITVYGSTTRPEQLELLRTLFEPYGYVRIPQVIARRTGSREIYFLCSLNASFDFLLEEPDQMPGWILRNNSCFINFLAGLIDAEGSFNLNRTQRGLVRGRFTIEMTKGLLLEQVREKLVGSKIDCSRLRRHRKAGHINKQGVTSRKDTWQFTVSAKTSLLQLITLMQPYVKHGQRRADMPVVKENIEWRNSAEFQEQLKQRRLAARASK